MSNAPLRWTIGIAVALAVMVVLRWRHDLTSPPAPIAPSAGPTTTGSPGGSSSTLPAPSATAVRDAVHAAARQLQAGSRAPANPADIASLLADLHAQLDRLSGPEAAQLLQSLLRSGLDAPTHLDLKPGRQGRLATVSSLRLFLLDELRQRDPAAAQAIAREILAAPGQPDEWALALAVVATDPSDAGRALTREKARALARHTAWQLNPSAGFLEAFDVFVHSQDTGFVADLAGMLAQTNNRALAHAAFLTLDRLVLAAPAATLSELLREPGLMAGREATRAGYFARVDARDPAQRTVLERYLLDPARSPAELDRWAGSFPNANFMISDNLITPSGPPADFNLPARRQAALSMIQEWLKDPRFVAAYKRLEPIRDRLAAR